MTDEQRSSLVGLQARSRSIPLDNANRQAFAKRFNQLAAMKHFGATLNLDDDYLVQVVLPKIEEHHRGGLGSNAINGAVIAGMFDCALGVAGVLQFPDKRTGTVELSIKILRPVLGSRLDFYAGAIKSSAAIAFAESELFSGGRTCAIATGIVAVASNKDWAAVP